jgi:uncharacterized protein
MRVPKEAVLLRIFIGEDSRYDHRPLFEAIVLRAREMHLAGATVLRGPLGYGHSSRLHTAKILRLSEDLPVVVEIVDSEEKINGFLPVLDGMMQSGLITLERAQVLHCGSSETSETATAVSASTSEVKPHEGGSIRPPPAGNARRLWQFAFGR